MITSVGKAALLLIFLTLWNAVNGGLNTLYMVYSALAAGLLVSWAGAKAASLSVEAKASLPDQIFAGDTVPLRLSIRNRGFIPLFCVSAVTRDSRIGSWEIGARGRVEAVIPYRFTRRGRIEVTDLFLEFSFPFGLFALRRRVALPRALVFPSPGEFAGRPRIDGAVVEDAARPRRGAGEEFLSVREFSPGDDVRLISWKLTAKLGRPLVREFAEMVGDRVTVRASGSPPGEATEERIREAAAIARYYIDEGLEVRLVTDEGETGFGRGLMHLEAILGMLASLGEGKGARGTGVPLRTQRPLPAPEENTGLLVAMWAMVAAAAASLWLAQGLDILTKIAVTAAVPLGFFFDRIGRHPVPAFILNALNLLVIAGVLFVDIPLSGLLPGLTHLLSWAFINRLVSRKTGRDGGTLAFICFLMFLLVSWQTIDPLYSAAFAAFFAAIGAWASFAASPPGAAGLRRALALGAAVLFALAASAAFFAATPRVENPRFAKMMRRMGLSNMVSPELSIVKLADRVTLGVFDDVRVNSRRVMQVKLSGIDVPEGTALYVRGGALDRFDGKDWTRSRYDFPYDYLGRPVWSRDGRALYEASGAGYAVPDGARGRPFATAEFFVYPMATSVIFSIGDPTKVEGDVVLPTFDLCGTAYSSSNFESGGRYVVTSSSPDIRIDDIVHGHEEVLSKLYLGIPSGRDMDEVKRLAKEVAGKARGPVAKARAIERYFRDGFVYSYLGKHGRQSISEFLTESRAANCEYFATAMAMMLRAEGVPARLAIGYLSTERRQVGDYFDVRNSDGHAWVEAYIPGRGWVAYDPTPDVVGFPEEGFILGREAYLYYLNLQMSWYRYVIGYDFYVQQDVLASIVAVWRDIAAAIAIAVMAVVAAWLAAIIAIGRIRRRRGGAATGSEAAVEWLEAEKLLSKFGFLRRRWQTPLEFASEVAEREPGLAAVGEVARAYYVWRYGEGGGEKMSGSVKHLKAALRRHGERTVGRRSGFSKR